MRSWKVPVPCTGMLIVEDLSAFAPMSVHRFFNRGVFLQKFGIISPRVHYNAFNFPNLLRNHETNLIRLKLDDARNFHKNCLLTT